MKNPEIMGGQLRGSHLGLEQWCGEGFLMEATLKLRLIGGSGGSKRGGLSRWGNTVVSVRKECRVWHWRGKSCGQIIWDMQEDGGLSWAPGRALQQGMFVCSGGLPPLHLSSLPIPSCFPSSMQFSPQEEALKLEREPINWLHFGINEQAQLKEQLCILKGDNPLTGKNEAIVLHFTN